MKKSIIVTEENKKNNKKLFKNRVIGSIFTGLPNSFKSVKSIEGGYSYRTEYHALDGWFDDVTPEFDPSTKRLGDKYFDAENKVFTKLILDIPEDEIAAKIEADKIAQGRNFIEAKKIAGMDIFNDFEFRITMSLVGQPLEDVKAIAAEIRTHLRGSLDLIKTGDFADASWIMDEQTPPSTPYVLELWNELKAICDSYYSKNYTTETI